MEEKFFTSTSNFFKWITEVADKGGLKILTLGTQGDTYWVTYKVKDIPSQPDVKKSVCEHKWKDEWYYEVCIKCGRRRK